MKSKSHKVVPASSKVEPKESLTKETNCFSAFFHSLLLQFAILLLLTFFALMGLTVMWSIIYSDSRISEQAQHSEVTFRQVASAAENFFTSQVDTTEALWSVAQNWPYADASNASDLTQAEPAMKMLRQYAQIGLSYLNSVTASVIGFSIGVSYMPNIPEAVPQGAITSVFWLNFMEPHQYRRHADSIEFGNWSGHGFYEQFKVPSWEAVAKDENLTLALMQNESLHEFTFPIEPIRDMYPSYVKRAYGLDTANDVDEYRVPMPGPAVEGGWFSGGVWGCVYDVNCWIQTAFQDCRIINDDGDVIWITLAVQLTSITAFLESQVLDSDSKAWIVDLERDALLGVSGVENLLDLVHESRFRMLKATEFPDPVVQDVSKYFVDGLHNGEEFADGESIAYKGAYGGKTEVFVKFINLTEYRGRFVVFHARPTWTAVRSIVAFVAISAVLSVFLALFISICWCITIGRMFKAMQTLMRQFGQALQFMNLEALDSMSRAPFTEIRKIQDRLLWMGKRLVEWRKFLPSSLVEEAFGQVNGGEGEEELEEIPLDSGASSDGESVQTGNSTGISDDGGASHSHSETSSMNSSLMSRRGQVLFRQRGFHTEFRGTLCIVQVVRGTGGDPYDVACHSFAFDAVLEMLDLEAKAHQGRVLEIHAVAGRVVVAFGGLRGQFAGQTQGQNAGAFALRAVTSGKSDGLLPVVVGITSGVGQIGTVGTHFQKKRVLGGEILVAADNLADLALSLFRSGDITAPVVCDRAFSTRVGKELQTATHSSATIAACACDVYLKVPVKDGRKVSVLYQPKPIFAGVADDSEWMYGRERADRLAAVQDANAAFEALATGDLDACEGLCEKLVGPVKERVQNACKEVREVSKGDVAAHLKTSLVGKWSSMAKTGATVCFDEESFDVAGLCVATLLDSKGAEEEEEVGETVTHRVAVQSGEGWLPDNGPPDSLPRED